MAAKLDLHERKTRKEDLTEHLLIIIQQVNARMFLWCFMGAFWRSRFAQNEARKALKLQELMSRLAVAEDGDVDKALAGAAVVVAPPVDDPAPADMSGGAATVTAPTDASGAGAASPSPPAPAHPQPS